MKKNIAVFSSGRGGNFENICNYFYKDPNVCICLHVTNNINSNSKKIADIKEIKTIYANKKILNTKKFYKLLYVNNVSFIVLAGFLLKIPSKIIDSYSKKIINLHPSLLPKYGGKGMYGDNIHLKVLSSNESKTGITIHYVDNEYDNGDIIFQKEIELEKNENLETLREKIRKIEYYHFPRIISSLL